MMVISAVKGLTDLMKKGFSDIAAIKDWRSRMHKILGDTTRMLMTSTSQR